MKMLEALSKFHNLEPKSGDIGIEVEMEGRRLPTGHIPGWRIHHEGSLRGEGVEYVLSEPCLEHYVNPLLHLLWNTFREKKTVLQPSHRCSVHVHINVQSMTEVQVFNFIILYLIAEDALVNWCGEGRVGNLFCLRARDAEFVIDSLEETSVDGRWDRLHTNDLRYAALNCKALGDFGSLEFRSLRGTDEPAIIETWVSILMRLREAAIRYDFPNNILDGFSVGGEEAFCREVFGDHFEELFTYDGWRSDVRSGMRRCQCIAYSGDWLSLSNKENTGRKRKTTKPRWQMKPAAPVPQMQALRQHDEQIVKNIDVVENMDWVDGAWDVRMELERLRLKRVEAEARERLKINAVGIQDDDAMDVDD